MSKETKNNYCGLAVINDELLFVCTNKVTTIWDCKYKKTSYYQICMFQFEDACGVQLCNCITAQKNVVIDLAAIQSGLNFAESK